MLSSEEDMREDGVYKHNLVKKERV